MADPSLSSSVAHPRRIIEYGLTVVIVLLCTGLNWCLLRWLSLTDLAMVYLLGVVIAAFYFRWDAAIAGALFSLLAFDFFFVPPVLTLRFDKNEHLITGAVLLLVGVITSVLASRVRKNLWLANQAALAAHDEHLRNSILASVSHDLRTPLAVIAGSASTLRENRAKLSPTEQDQLLDAIFEQSQIMSTDISDVLEMTKLNAGSVVLRREWHPLEELVGATLERCKSKLTAHYVSVQIASSLPMIYVDGVLFEKLLINLIENAAKYTPKGSRIEISASHIADRIDVVVADDGPGLTQGMELALFEKFARASQEGATVGSGLGLSICRAIVQLHGMDIKASNAADEIPSGARITVSIPFQAPPETRVEQ